MFAFWCDEQLNVVEEFVEQFVALFNVLAEKKEVAALFMVSFDGQEYKNLFYH